MIVSGNDLLLVYSGGNLNSSAYNSLGGEPSSFQITGTLNNLFENIDENETKNGNIDYKCIYLINNSSSSSFYNLRLYVKKEDITYTNIQIGIKRTKETQRFIINYNNVTGGFVSFTYQNQTVNANWNHAGHLFALNIKNSLNTIFSNVETFLIEKTNSQITIDIKFNDEDDYRFHDILECDIDNLISPNQKSFFISRSQVGSPINYVHDILETKNTTPYGVTFDDYNENYPLFIGTLKKEECLPLWFKRICVKNTPSISNDNFKLKIISSPIKN